jgi:hypothetical protein
VKPAMTARRVDVANMTSTTALSLKVFLRSNDKEMSDLIVSNSETDNLIAYIQSEAAAISKELGFQISNGVGRLRTYISFTHSAL